MKKNCLDSSAWIEVFHGGSNAREFLRVLHDPTSIFVSSISLYEVWKYSILHADVTRAKKIRQVMQQGIVVPVDVEIAIQSAELSIQYKLPLADSMIYASALIHKAILWTQDSHFDGLPHVRYIQKTNP
jgi:predicted nucleic acid-binding protein